MEEIKGTNGIGYEATDPPVRTIVYAAFGLAVGAIVVCVMLAWFLRFLIATENPGQRNPLAPEHSVPPEPRVEVHPWEQIRQLRAHEDEVLRGYGWIDKSKGVVHIPIDRAMDLTLQQGLPMRKEIQKK